MRRAPSNHSSCPRFVTAEDIAAADRRLSVIADVSCDPESEYNPIPIYSQCTKFDSPTLSIIGGENPLDVVAIDHLPSMLPLEARIGFSQILRNG